MDAANTADANSNQGKGKRGKAATNNAAASGAGGSSKVAAASSPSAAPSAGETNAYIPGASAAVPKQGAYGKVKIHTESKLAQLSHLDEVFAAVAYKLGWTDATRVVPLSPNASSHRIFCETLLTRVSRSFAMVIQQLPDHLRTAVCVFYLVLRGLDTVEDDMEAYKDKQEEKLFWLRTFFQKLTDPDFLMTGVGEGDEAHLLEHFYHVNRVFLELPEEERSVIADICKRMGEGMASYCGRDLREGTRDVSDYNLYCHYVAGLVGEGLSRLFVSHGDEEPIVAKDLKLADDMGLFLQKTNIIRDYLEDLVDGRAFWPKQVWSLYAPKLASLRQDRAAPADLVRVDSDKARSCLNHLIADALLLAPSCIRYLERLRHKDIFRFCTIPQVMAIATLDKLANNHEVFTGVVKIRKGQALKLMQQSGSMTNVYLVFLKHARSICAKIPEHHAEARKLSQQALAQIEALCLARLPASAMGLALSPLFSPGAVVLVISALVYLLKHLYSQSSAWRAESNNFLPRITDSWDVAALAGVVACIAYLFACAGVPIVLGAISQQQSEGKGASLSYNRPPSPSRKFEEEEAPAVPASSARKRRSRSDA